MIKVLLMSILIHYAQSQSSHHVSGPSIYQLTDPVEIAEGPTWDPRTNRLYFVDIPNGRVYSYNPETGQTHFITLDGTVTPVVQSKTRTDQFYVGVNRTLMRISWDGKHKITAQETLTTVSKKFPMAMFDDGKADSRGRLWFGTLGTRGTLADGITPNQGSLYFITKKNLANPLEVISPVTISNGMAWNRANDKFFYIDSATFDVVQYDYDDASGEISNRKVVINMKKAKLGADALPDGMTIDAEDNLWVALFGAGSVVHVNSTDGSIIRRVVMPAKYVTSCMWGGRNLDVLFVTTARSTTNVEQRLPQPAAGSLFAVEGLGTQGLPVFGGDI